MTTFETSQGFAQVEQYRVNVTTRLDAEHRQYMQKLTEKTIKLWLAVAKKIVAGERQFDYPHSPESAMAKDEPGCDKINTPLAEPRVTIWGDPIKDNGFTVHSHTLPQDALDSFWSRYDALQSFKSAEPPAPSSTPVAPQNPANANVEPNKASFDTSGDRKFPTTKEALEALDIDALFVVPVSKVMLRSQDGNEYWELYGKYGGKPAQYPDMRVYRDNEVAQKNGLASKLDAFGLMPGKELVGEWTLKAKVGERKGKKVAYPVALKDAA